MYILGHMVWSYVVCRGVARATRTDIPLYAALVMGAVPDFDLYLVPFGFTHHTYSHSLLVWAPVFAGMFFVWRRRTLPYIAGIGQHFLIGDLLVGSVPILLPLSDLQLGLNLAFQPRNDIILEVGMLLLAGFLAYRRGDLRRSLAMDGRNALMVIPLIGLVSLTLLFANEFNVDIIEYGFASVSLSLITISHIVFSVFLTASTMRGFQSRVISLRSKRPRRLVKRIGGGDLRGLVCFYG